MSPGETVAIVRHAFREEAKKWRRHNVSSRETPPPGKVAHYHVFRVGYPDGELPDLDSPRDEELVIHQWKTLDEANKIIADAAWAAAVTALVEAEKPTA